MASWTAAIAGTGLLCILLITSPTNSAQCETLRNQYIRLDLKGSSIVRLQVDPNGQGARSLDFARNLNPEFWQTTPETKITVSGSRANITNLQMRAYTPITNAGDIDLPDRLEPGHTLSQTFSIPPGVTFNSASAKIPTWNKNNSGVTLSLYKDDLLLASRRIRNAKDNAWQAITTPMPCGKGTYKLEISEPVGEVGWWSSSSSELPTGKAQADGKAVQGSRDIRIDGYKMNGTGQIHLALDGSVLRVQAELTPAKGTTLKTLPWRWNTSWTANGYDCSPKAGVVFSRFFSDNQRYIPVQQLKRRKSDGGIAFNGCKWIEMDGTHDADLVLSSSDIHMHWELSPRQMSIRFDTPVKEESGILKSEWTLMVKSPDGMVPDEFPHFSCSDPKLEQDLNTFWWERAFSYPSPASGAAEWFEWMALTRGWFAGPQRDGETRALLDVPLTNEGYVHTWGGTVGWPLVRNRDTRHFDTNARFILACWRHYLWTGDKEFLEKQADRLRSAMYYQLEILHGKDGLIVTPDVKTGRHQDLSDNYWDVLPFGHLDAYANIAYYGSLSAMEQMQKALGETPLVNYAALRDKAHERYDEVFWNNDAGRYVGCVDIDGIKHDYGFTFVNLEALYYGLGDAEKAKRIYKWMETEPTSSGKADTYSQWIFAPRTNTIHNPMWRDDAPADERKNKAKPWWTFWWKGTRYGAQCQDGGAILYTSFFDLMNRTHYQGADNAWERFMEILSRYRMPDKLCGGSPLYRGEKPQQEDAGSIGVDMPFPESGLVPCYFLYGVIGLEATPEGLRITPSLPNALEYAEVRKINWQGMSLRIRVTRSSATVDGSTKDGRPYRRIFRIKEGRGAIVPMEAAR